jgi:transcriptional regulator with XRE-family HTH domain
MKKGQIKRKRGVSLSASGIRRLRQAMHNAETAENGGRRLTIEVLSSRTGVSVTTISRLWSAKSGVDQRTLRLIFSAFNLELAASDVQDLESISLPDSATDSANLGGYPSGPVPLDSPFYMLRPPIESLAFAEITQPGCLLRIKAPAHFGKSSLLLRILQQAQHKGYKPLQIDLRQVDPEILTNANACLQWFCTVLSIKLGLTPQLKDYWNEIVGDALSATLYLREHILSQVDRPVVLAINQLNRIFEYPVANALLPLLRSWHEETKHDPVWQHLRLVVVYSTDVYLPLDINQSPFNIGLPLTLPEFTPEQVQTFQHRLASDAARIHP